MPEAKVDEFYVGYLAMPRGYARFLRVLLPLTLWGMLIGAAGVSATQRDPGGAVWRDTELREFQGLYVARPYPMLLVSEGGAERAFLLVQQGKLGAAPITGSGHARPAIVRGWVLERDGRSIVELSPGEPAGIEFPAAPGAVPAEPIASEHGEVELVGEIMDAKCFLGAMKPGEGRAHRSCATLCIAGGIPPVLVTRDRVGRASYVLLQSADAGPATDLVLAHVGVPVRVRGVLSENAGWSRLSITRGSISAAD